MTFISTNYLNLPTAEEMLPFTVNALGAVSSTQNPADWARQHLLDLLLTSPGERVMRPSYGVGLDQFVFENIDPLTLAQIQTTINTQVQQYIPSITVSDVSAQPNPFTAGEFDVIVTYTVNNSMPQVLTTTVSQ